MKAIVVKPDGRTTIKELGGWSVIQAEIDGVHLELIELPGFACYVDQNGIAKGLSRNQTATNIVERALAKVGRSLLPGDFIKGTAVFVGRSVVDDPEARLWDVSAGNAQRVEVDDDLPQSVIDDYFATIWTETLPKVAAYVHSDDYVFDATFDATPWFEQASDDEILALAKIGWKNDYEADEVARFVESERVEVVFDYCRRKQAQGNTVGFEAEINPTSALEWLRQHRPHLSAKLEKSE
jgi:hypothetical protein